MDDVIPINNIPKIRVLQRVKRILIGIALFPQYITGASDSMNKARFILRFQLTPQIAYIYLQNV